MTTIIGQLRGLLTPVIERVYRYEEVPEGAEFPYADLLEIHDAAALHGDSRSNAAYALVQVDLWQSVDAVNDALRPSVRAALNGVRLDPTQAEGPLRVHVQDIAHLIEERLVHDVLTVRVARLTS